MPNRELKCRVYELAARHLLNAGSAIWNWRFAFRDHQPEHTLLLIGGRKMDYPALGEYGMNIVSLGPGESLRVAISEKSGVTWDLGDPSIGIKLFSARVARVDRTSVVIERNVPGDYGIASPSLKFFLDLTSRKVLKTVPLDNPAASVVRLQLAGLVWMGPRL